MWAGGPEAGRSINNIFSNWGDGQPNNFGGNEDCVEIYQSDGRWHDVGCDASRWSLIEYSCPLEQEFGPTACQSTSQSCTGLSSTQAPMHAPFSLVLRMLAAPTMLRPDRDRAHATQDTRAMV